MFEVESVFCLSVPVSTQGMKTSTGCVLGRRLQIINRIKWCCGVTFLMYNPALSLNVKTVLSFFPLRYPALWIYLSHVVSTLSFPKAELTFCSIKLCFHTRYPTRASLLCVYIFAHTFPFSFAMSQKTLSKHHPHHLPSSSGQYSALSTGSALGKAATWKMGLLK